MTVSLNQGLPADYQWVQKQLKRNLNSGKYVEAENKELPETYKYYENRQDGTCLTVKYDETGAAEFSVGTLFGDGKPAYTYSVCDTEQNGTLVNGSSCLATYTGQNGIKSEVLDCNELPES